METLLKAQFKVLRMMHYLTLEVEGRHCGSASGERVWPMCMSPVLL